jgi:hypothetical protein
MLLGCVLFEIAYMAMRTHRKLGTAPTGRRELQSHVDVAVTPTNSGGCTAHVGYFVPLTKIADFLRADVEVSVSNKRFR